LLSDKLVVGPDEPRNLLAPGGERTIPLSDCRLVSLPKVEDARGNLTVIEGYRSIDFDIKRVYYLYDVPGGADRAGHAHRTLRQLIVAASGSFDVVLDDGREQQRFHLNRAYTGLYLAPLVWRRIDNFSGGSVCLVLASALYDESDYIRDYDEFLRVVHASTA
jgi:WxcM-like protein